MFDIIHDNLQNAKLYQPYLQLKAIKIRALDLEIRFFLWLIGDKSIENTEVLLSAIVTFANEAQMWIMESEKESRQKENRLPHIIVGDYKAVAQTLTNLRKYVGRISVIARTGFLPIGYLFLRFLLLLLIVMLIVCRFKNQVTEFIIISFVLGIFAFEFVLIKDVDDPFTYKRRALSNMASMSKEVIEAECTLDNFMFKHLPHIEKSTSEIHLFPLFESFHRRKMELATL